MTLTTAETRFGPLTIERIDRQTIAYIVDGPADAATRHRAHRAAVAWMAANPAEQRGVTRYRFDEIRDGVRHTDAF